MHKKTRPVYTQLEHILDQQNLVDFSFNFFLKFEGKTSSISGRNWVNKK